MRRLAIEIRGIVQGVGFRPHVHGLARRLNLGGFVKNRGGSVLIEVEGEACEVDRFCRELTQAPPKLARIDSLSCSPCPAIGQQRFTIEPSPFPGSDAICVAPDTAVCNDCLRELFDPSDRRYRYPLINCINCGPRLTIVTGAPYDRERTTMTSFVMCQQCQAEYEDPHNRRFHAQPIACPACGPRLTLRDRTGEPLTTDDPLTGFAEALVAGQIGALKGLGGYHLACNATNENIVRELRRRKHRDEKPFAVMVRGIAAAEAICHLAPDERLLLTSAAAPIVLLRRRSGVTRCTIAPSVAPGNPYLGVMLPYTPLHHLLLAAVADKPLVMTSGNRSDEPIAYLDEDALTRLAGIADVFLTHDRPIHVRCDDSVTRVIGRTPAPLRRSRGYTPEPLALPFACPLPILAVGGQLKGTFALGRDRQALVSHHLGDIEHLDAYRALVRDIALYEELFAIRPTAVAHDLHPDYASSRYAAQRGLPVIPVQHHHAHLASCLAENGLDEPVIGVTFDGAGLGTDGHIWGGEFLVGDCGSIKRVASLRYVGMPGGEQAVREPWRMALSHALDAGCDPSWLKLHVSQREIQTVQTMLQRQCNTPLTSSMGRLFDAIAALTRIRTKISFEGQAAMQLEWLAMDSTASGFYACTVTENEQTADFAEPDDAQPDWIIDTRPLIRGLCSDLSSGASPATIARRFHSSIVELIADICGRIRTEYGLAKVVLTGGVFSNVLLSSETEAQLTTHGFSVYTHRRVPASDGGLALGQLVVAARRLASTVSQKV